MSMYGEDGSTGYPKENLRNEIDDFLKDHPISELMSILTDAIEYKEWCLKEDQRI